MSPEISHAQMVGAERGRLFHVSLYDIVYNQNFIQIQTPTWQIWASLRNGDKYVAQCDPLKQIPYEWFVTLSFTFGPMFLTNTFLLKATCL